MHYTVATVNSTGYFVTRNLGRNRYEGVSGVDFELLQILSKHLNFTYVLVSPKDKQWGALKENGDWSDMVGMLQKNEADFAIDGIALTYPRTDQLIVHFFITWIMTSLLSNKTELCRVLSSSFTLFNPWSGVFSWYACYFAQIFFHFSNVLKYVEEKKNDKRLKNTFSMMEILTGNRGFGKFFRKDVSKIFFILSAFPIRVLMFCFTGLLLSFLMAPAMEYQVKTFESLAKASRFNVVKVTNPKGNYIHRELKEAKAGIFGDLGNNLRIYPEDTAINRADMIEKTMCDYALLEIGLYLQFLVHEFGLKNEIFVSEDSLKRHPLAILFRKGFCCIKNFDNIIFRIYQSGVYLKLVRDQLFKLSLKTKPLVSSTGHVRPITLNDFIAVFGLLILGYTFATAALFYERYSHKWHKVPFVGNVFLELKYIFYALHEMYQRI